MASGEEWSYRRAGVDVERQRALQKRALEFVSELNRDLGFTVEGLGGYAPSILIDNMRVALHVDGVGTKTLVLRELGKLWVAGWDCIAVNVNDVVCEGFRPLAAVDYIAMPMTDEEAYTAIIEGLVKAARVAGVAVVGGETAIMPDLINGIDVVCAVLAMGEGASAAKKARAGDVVIGVESWGLHANGYTLVRRVLQAQGYSYRDVIEGVDISAELSKPTAIYSGLVLELMARRLITAAAHITGGGLTKLRRILGPSTGLRLTMPRPPRIFEIIQSLGKVKTIEMYKTFNMGVGLAVTARPEGVEEVLRVSGKHGFKAYVIGEVVGGDDRILVTTHNGETFTL